MKRDFNLFTISWQNYYKSMTGWGLKDFNFHYKRNAIKTEIRLELNDFLFLSESYKGRGL